ncbi:helix-turn-helix domain-containing protein [Kineococcus rhizosphaerae]|uniref:GAF domain-containing protein n=1 Tax=Kineococcus rhizosphaerae TaxID=559628 RepID=A0A2T0QXA9_9ACTN|nr:helix-turn-helix domain-containing protein [Kineococcus rhizosphaerae]PRY10490.1 GAF domain-containing protein [Kineococcus rhizosphaerae]
MSDEARPFDEPATDVLLRTISDTAVDLANVGARDVVLGAVLRRTRDLLGADMAYLSLNDLGSGTTYVELTEGVRTAQYRAIRMPFGTGVLGSAAAGATTVHTTDYLADAHLHHLPAIDAVVRGEGVRAIAGAPMRLGGRVVGALVVAHRSPRTLGARAREALEQMSVQAAVALEQTRRGEEIARLRGDRDAQFDPEGAADERRQLQDLLTLDERLTGAMVGMVTAAGVLAVLEETVGRPLALLDPAGALLLGRELLGAEALDDWRLRAAVRTSHQGGGVTVAHTVDGTHAVLAVTAVGEHLATLLLPEPDAESIRLVSHTAGFLSVALLVERALAEADESAQTTLVEELLDARAPARPTLAGRLAHYGLHLGTPVAVLVVDVPAARVRRAAQALRGAIPGTGVLLSAHGRHLCLLAHVDGDDTGAGTGVAALAARLGDALAAAGLAAPIGSATAVSGNPHDVRRSHEEASRLAASARALGWTSGHADFAAVGPAGAVVRDHSGDTARSLVDRFLGPVVDYDARRGTQLTETLWHYFAGGELLAPAAAALHVHTNTVRQRLDRVDELLGAQWRDPEGRFNTQFAVRLWRTAGPCAGQEPGVVAEPNCP